MKGEAQRKDWLSGPFVLSLVFIEQQILATHEFGMTPSIHHGQRDFHHNKKCLQGARDRRLQVGDCQVAGANQPKTQDKRRAQ